jgi:hypothetical protein
MIVEKSTSEGAKFACASSKEREMVKREGKDQIWKVEKKAV